MSLQVYDLLKYLAITSNDLPYEVAWILRVFYTRRKRWNSLEISKSKSLSPVYQIIIGMITATAGGTIISLVSNLKINWIASDILYLVAIACWIAVQFNTFTYVYESRLFQIVAIFGETISWVRSLLGGIDTAISIYPGSFFAIYLFAILSGSAGALVGQIEIRKWANSSEMKGLPYSPTGVHVSLCMGVLYVLLSQVFLFPKESIQITICGCLLVFSFMAYFGILLDPLRFLLCSSPSTSPAPPTNSKKNKSKNQ
eukprot:Phypoly_transcript_15554.p1 GENE.Phypoly_transcript_15554~~Phypoly_transcript_15554.p1  ORF type:complete len:256 (+),score=24.62 Phypoly_transcript_15554:137-904(+)